MINLVKMLWSPLVAFIGSFNMCLICLQFLEDRMVREEVKYALRELREEDDHTLNLKTLIEETK